MRRPSVFMSMGATSPTCALASTARTGHVNEHIKAADFSSVWVAEKKPKSSLNELTVWKKSLRDD